MDHNPVSGTGKEEGKKQCVQCAVGAKEGENKPQDNQQESSPETFRDVQMLTRGAAFPGRELKRSSQQIVKPLSGCVCFCPEVDTFFIYTTLGRFFNIFVSRFYHLKMGIKKS